MPWFCHTPILTTADACPNWLKTDSKGSVFLTEASFPLLELMLMDAVHLQLRDTEWENKRRERAGKSRCLNLYIPRQM